MKNKTIVLSLISLTFVLGVSGAGLALAADSPINLTSPKAGETLVQGGRNVISWTGGKNKVLIGLTNYNFDPMSGSVAGWISSNAVPNGSLAWDGKTLCDVSGSNCRALNSLAGNSYKIVLISEDANGNYCMWSKSGGCNVFISNNSISVVSSAVAANSATPDKNSVLALILDSMKSLLEQMLNLLKF